MTASRGFAPQERLQMPVEPALRNRQKPTPPPVTRSGARDAAHAARITAAVIAVMAVAVGLWFSRTAILLAFAGIPLTSGFVSKFAVFKAAGEGGAIPLVIVGVIASAIAAYFYVRVIVLMFFTEPPDDAPDVVAPSILSTSVVTVTAAVTFALGALPQPLLDLANIADQFLR